jgi:rhodanese-related sulfurtransferase
MKLSILNHRSGQTVLNPAGFLLAAALCISSAVAAEQSDPIPQASPVIHVNAVQAQKLIARTNVVVLDIRTPEEFKSGRITGATNINFRETDFEKRIAGLDKGKSYLVHCASGGRSTQSLSVFEKHHFQSVFHLDGGIKAWEKAGLPVEK